MLVNLATMFENGLICKIVLRAHYGQDDRSRVRHVFFYQVQDEIFVRFRLGLVGRMNEARQINQRTGGIIRWSY